MIQKSTQAALMHEPPHQEGDRLIVPPEQLYWAVIKDVPAGAGTEALRYAFEPWLPVGIEAVESRFLRSAGGQLIACFPVASDDQIMLATSTGQSIRCPVDGISFRSRSAGGVKVFDTGAGEFVVSVARIAEQGDEEPTEE